MSENSTPAPAAAAKIVACRCLLGWTGTAGSGSTLAMAENPGTVCERTTRKSFAQGHDARMSSRLAKEIAASETTGEVAAKLIQLAGGTDLLIEKTLRSAKLRLAAQAAKAKKAAAPATEKAPLADDDEQAAAGAENMASDEGISLDEARERMGLAPLDGPERSGPGMNSFTDPQADDEPPALPEVGTDVKVPHGKRTYSAKVIEAHTGERVASHKLGNPGRDCYHDLTNGEIIALADEEVPF